MARRLAPWLVVEGMAVVERAFPEALAPAAEGAGYPRSNWVAPRSLWLVVGEPLTSVAVLGDPVAVRPRAMGHWSNTGMALPLAVVGVAPPVPRTDRVRLGERPLELADLDPAPLTAEAVAAAGLDTELVPHTRTGSGL